MTRDTLSFIFIKQENKKINKALAGKSVGNKVQIFEHRNGIRHPYTISWYKNT